MASPPHPLARRAFLIRRSLKRKAPLRFSALVGGVVESAPSSSQRRRRVSARLRESARAFANQFTSFVSIC